VRDKGPAGQDLVRPSTLSSMAKESIRVRIVTGEIAAGEIYSAPALAAVLGVSATPVREALLAQRGELRESAREHSELLEAICRQDPAAVSAIATHHLEHTRGIWAGIAETAGQ
jgi:DNA-binding GntR family transcriptional regulator